MTFQQFYDELPLVAILRGIQPEKAVETTAVLYEAGFRLIEVPLNSPDVFTSIKLLSEAFAGRAMIGAGTVLSAGEVDQVAMAGGLFIVSPNCNMEVIKSTKRDGLISLPGIATPSEAFTALENDADGLKVFPAELIPPQGIKALLAVLPKGTDLVPVGGIDHTNMEGYLKAGATGFGFGGSLFKPAYDLQEIGARAERLVNAYRKIKGE